MDEYQAYGQSVADYLLNSLSTVIVGQRENLRLLLATVLTGGHVLLEDKPGVGKTVLARSLGSLFGLELSRIQGTSDLLPTDVTGVHIFNPELRSWEFRSGPIFAPIVLVDELNRATAKAQSALLEAMAERQVTVEGETMPLPEPFVVIATQNPHGDAGTHRLGTAQLDRFAVQLSLGLPGREAERAILTGEAGTAKAASIEPVASAADLPRIFQTARTTHVSEPLFDYTLEVIAALRSLDSQIWLSVRVAQTTLSLARGLAFMNRRAYVAPEDVRAAVLPVVRHRIQEHFDTGLLQQRVLSVPAPVQLAA